MKKFKLEDTRSDRKSRNKCNDIISSQSDVSSQGTIVGKVCRVNDNGSEADAESQYTNVIVK